MRIKRLELHNFGVYAGTNVFEFESQKPIVLIGGMNGHGKTSFLEAVLLALYGNASPGYKEKKKLSYHSYLKSYINRSDFTNSTYIRLDFIINHHEEYEVTRSWFTSGRNLSESVKVKHNGIENEFLAQNWKMFVENILPNSLSDFFFFDGEKIAEMAIDKDDGKMKKSVKSMLGISILDTMNRDLLKLLQMNKTDHHSKDQALEEIGDLRDKLSKAESEETILNGELKELTEKKEAVEEEIKRLQNEYQVKGGEALEQRKALMEEQALLQNRLATITEELITVASSALPLKLVEDMLLSIKVQADDEQYNRNMHFALDAMKEKLPEFSQKNEMKGNEIEQFLQYLKNDIGTEDEEVYELSDHALYQLHQLLEKDLEQQSKNAISLIETKKETEKRLDEVSSYLSLDINSTELDQIVKLIDQNNEELHNLSHDCSKKELELKEITSLISREKASLNKKVEEYLQETEHLDDEIRKNKYINMAMDILESFKYELQRDKTEQLGETITKQYLLLANKKNLIQKIIMEPDTLNMHYLTSDGTEVLRDSLSAGEKQLLVVATLWALAICSKKKLPVIIDTPLARLDSKHRSALVTTYFPNASEQTIILSTDSEIDQNYYELMKDSIGDEFLLEYNEETRSTMVKHGYFREA